MRTLLLLNVFEPEAIGARIQKAREQAGLRQEDLADLLDVSTRTIQNYEGGATKPFRLLNEIARVLHVPTETLLHGDPDAPNPDRLEEVAAEVAALRADVRRIHELVQSLLEDRSRAI